MKYLGEVFFGRAETLYLLDDETYDIIRMLLEVEDLEAVVGMLERDFADEWEERCHKVLDEELLEDLDPRLCRDEIRFKNRTYYLYYDIDDVASLVVLVEME